LMMAEGKSPRNDKGMIDRKAAALILQDWLNQRRTQLGS
jgi:putative holliday junction resolvase